jgi:hypothetical protein
MRADGFRSLRVAFPAIRGRLFSPEAGCALAWVRFVIFSFSERRCPRILQIGWGAEFFLELFGFIFHPYVPHGRFDTSDAAQAPQAEGEVFDELLFDVVNRSVTALQAVEDSVPDGRVLVLKNGRVLGAHVVCAIPARISARIFGWIMISPG